MSSKKMDGFVLFAREYYRRRYVSGEISFHTWTNALSQIESFGHFLNRPETGIPFPPGHARRAAYFCGDGAEFGPVGRAPDQPPAGAFVRDGDGEGLCDFSAPHALLGGPGKIVIFRIPIAKSVVLCTEMQHFHRQIHLLKKNFLYLCN